MSRISLFASLLFALILCSVFLNQAAADIVIGGGGGGVVIGIGGGGSSPTSPQPSNCPPPPPPPIPVCPPPPPRPPPLIFDSKRIEIVYPVIQKFRSKITCDPKGITRTWVGSDICNKYMGFKCDFTPDKNEKALAGVDFNGFLFGGPNLDLTGFLDQLPDIAIFHANSNNFTGAIPKGIRNLRYLYELDLSNNKYSGEFPVDVLGATGLTFLDLRFNSFSGTIPPQLLSLDQLDVLFINNNGFHPQTLPGNLGATKARYLIFANNKFTGEIPRSIGQASETLTEVLFLNNSLSGCLPIEIGLLGKATVFDAGQNQLTGPIPHSFGCLEGMQLLNLAENQLYGSVPEVVCKLPNLVNLSLSWNYFTQVGPVCKNLIERGVLDVRKNCIRGLPSQRSPQECARFSSTPKYSPDLTSTNNIPCSKSYLNSMKKTANQPEQVATAAPLPLTYAALAPNRP
ncbi:uncharacterized protein At4g06744-like [Punica granatum]|uniref:Leucine-rich repeat-containing N-terminal plant-type domain-containing protein n=2 Tax=Punica granatum TaxID=22663 RepID=A0A218XFH7_PUNGR|nr:uncharacterized protein At4g06744-like [Punica granatum]OWM83707.1 hypothetical protein CDL15_Pgr004137 [Punica granatum]PKI75308.1 hypothetical protein CRG98_004348 [Punica granatum]